MPAITILHTAVQRSILYHDEVYALVTRKRSSSSKIKKPGVVYVGGGSLETWEIVLIVLGSILAACLIAGAIYW
jgi:hypothetical protein